MTNGSHKLARAPRTNDSILHICITRDVNHRSETAGNQNRVIVRGIDLGQLAAPIQSVERLALKKLLLSLILLVVSIIGCPPPTNGRELNGYTRLVKHLERVGNLSKEEPSLAIVRPDGGCIGDNKQNILGHGGAPALAFKRLVSMVRSCDPTFTADILA